MVTSKLRGLLVKGSVFNWTKHHQSEFDMVKSILTNFEYLRLHKAGNETYAVTDASLSGLGFILFQRDKEGISSILQVGSTYLKNSQHKFLFAKISLIHSLGLETRHHI